MTAKPNGAAQDTYVRLYLDHPQIGCGYREFLVLTRHRIWTRLLCISTFEVVKLESKLFEGMTATALPFRKGRLESRIRENARLYAARKGLLHEAIKTVRGHK